MISGKLAVSAINPVAIINASAAEEEKSKRKRMLITMGVSSNAAPSLAKKAAIIAPKRITMGKSSRPLPPPKRAICNAAQAKKPASSSNSEITIKATKVKLASQTICQTILISVHCTTPSINATQAPPKALQPMPRPLGCQITKTKVTKKTVNANMLMLHYCIHQHACSTPVFMPIQQRLIAALLSLVDLAITPAFHLTAPTLLQCDCHRLILRSSVNALFQYASCGAFPLQQTPSEAVCYCLIGYARQQFSSREIE